MSNSKPSKKCQFLLDGTTKQDSHSWMSKLLLNKRITSNRTLVGDKDEKTVEW